MLVQVGVTSPPLRPAPMTKFDLLLQQAEVSARRAHRHARTTPPAVSYDPHRGQEESRRGSLARRRREGDHARPSPCADARRRCRRILDFDRGVERDPAGRLEAGRTLAHGEKRRATSPRSGDRRRVQPSPPQLRGVAHRAGRGRALHRPHGRRRRNGRPDAEITFPHTLVAAFAPRRAIVGGLPGPFQDKARRHPSKRGARRRNRGALTWMGAEIGARHKGAFARLSTRSSRPWTLPARKSFPALKEEAR